MTINALILCKSAYYMQTEAFARSMCFMYVRFASWSGLFSLACLQVLMKSEPLSAEVIIS